MLKKILLVGHPNAGKTTLFNLITGHTYKTGNYPGITVDYHYGKSDSLYDTSELEIIDTPGITTLFPNSKEEEITRDAIFEHPKFGKADAIIYIVDATQLSRHLYIVKKLKECGLNIIIAVTMLDILKRRGKSIDIDIISKSMNIPTFPIHFQSKSDIKTMLQFIQKETFEVSSEIKQIEKQSSEEVINDYKVLNAIEQDAIREDLKNAKESLTQKIDKIVLNPYLGGLIFFFVMGMVFTSIYWLAAPFMDFIDDSFSNVVAYLNQIMPNSLLSEFLTEAIISGVGAVVVFLPQIVILFLLLGLLEDSGYLARAAVIVDRPLQKLGISGRAFVPMLSGFACAIPAMLSARTIKDPKERFMVLFLIPLMSCSARLPVYTILLTLITPKDKPWIGGLGLLAIYIMTIIFASIIAFILNRKKTHSTLQFALELPSYKKPIFSTIFSQVKDKSFMYLKDAGTVILMISVIMWALATFPKTADDVSETYIGQAGQFIEPALDPMGLDWRAGVSIISSFAAREVFVSSLIMVFKVSNDDDFENESIRNSLLNNLNNATHIKTGKKLFTFSTIIGLIVFYIFALLCFPTVTVAKKEFGSWKTASIQFFVFTITGYILSVFTVQVLQSIGFA